MILTHTRLDELLQSIQQINILKIFDVLLIIATDLGASDIHIEPFEISCRMRVRIDGVLHQLCEYPKSIHENIIAKFKIESGQMRPDEKRLPQDARVSTVTSTKKDLDLRANTSPTVRGEKLVLRIVDKSKSTPELFTLGIEGINKEILERNIHYPNGIILMTGPTGSGKTTTLYSCLSQLNHPEVNIMTYEDPVENKLQGINQSQIRPDINYTFAQGLRASLRQDPDIVMVGEIRDWETLETAMEASMTGHLVFSTLHTNSSSETLTRVMNLGAQPYMITGTFNLIAAQRLARKIAPEHKKEISAKISYPLLYANAVHALSTMDAGLLDAELARRDIPRTVLDSFLQQGMIQGCDISLGETAYIGRIGLYEMLEFDDEIKQMLLDNHKSLEIEKYALEKKGMINLERDGVFKALQGHISLQEVYRLVRAKKK